MMVPFVEVFVEVLTPVMTLASRSASEKNIPCCSHSLSVPLRAGSAGHVHLR